MNDIKKLEEAIKRNELYKKLLEYSGEDRIISSHEKLKEIEGYNDEEEKFFCGIEPIDNIFEGFRLGTVNAISGPTGEGKCLAKGTEIIMFDGTLKKVEDILIGDKLMGIDSKPRFVLGVGSGKERMFEIKQIKGDSYKVNGSHMLSLKRTGTGTKKDWSVINISVYDYLNQSKTFKHCHKGYKTGIDFNHKRIIINPYFIGLWLGDGASANQSITTADDEVVKFLLKFSASLNLNLKKTNQKNNKASVYSCNNKKGHENFLRTALRNYGLLNNKHIPKEYLLNSKKIRLDVLAGLIDSDGYVNHGGYVFVNKNKKLAIDVCFLARSLGFYSYIKSFNAKIKNRNFIGKYWKVGISGNCSIIPVKIDRKKVSKRKQKKDVLMTGIKIISYGLGDYYGFEIDGDGLFLLKDFTVTHNTTLAQTLTRRFADNKIPCAWFSFEVMPREFFKKFGNEVPLFYLPKEIPENSNNIQWIRERIIEAQAKYKAKIIFIDHLHYLQDMQNIASRNNTSLYIGDILRKLKRISINLEITIFLIVHVKTDAGNQAEIKKYYTKDDIRDSSFVKQEADTVSMIWRKREKDNKSEVGWIQTAQAILNIDKHRRTGVVGFVKLTHENGYFRTPTEYELSNLSGQMERENNEWRT